MLPESVRLSILWASDFVWGPWTLAFLLGTGLFLTLRYRFVQVTRFPEAARTLVPAQQEGARGALTPFQAFMTALAASIGTGNIAGVATAVVSGGPGAVFWIWCYGFFATVIKLTEAMLGVRYRAVKEGHVSAGPMYYLRDGLRSPALAWLYALVAGIAALTTTPFTQPNSMAVVMESQLYIPREISGVGIAVLAWLVIIGGVRSIGRVAEKLAPLKVGLYLLGGLWVILFHAGQLPAVFALIFREAFSMEAAGGGAAGVAMMTAMRYGLARGIYANEAGYGTAAVAYGSARSERPVQQGLNAVMEVFIVSFVTSSISALTVLVSGVWRSGATSTALVASAFNTAMPLVGGWVVAFCAFLFGYTTLIGWAYYGEQFLEYIVGAKVTRPYRWVYCGLIYFGAVGKPETVWAWGDLMNGLQIFPNMVGLIGLSGLVAAALRGRGQEGPPPVAPRASGPP
ncbi:alanine/glycine:cation symporter family protein [Stigmatella aurantiaca]|uniref:Sodium:alanine symporter n=2 Tax=Stigmatella aurantiaca (strain DW4/3-1) TaxID=378806 RepID=E3FLH7_STIAD|nr:amino acid carrier protein [Stigmatella aurantiaca]ADO73069.1 Sodium:alanine symporter [Stigmatella aurantiaca DW4/3-1]